MRDTEPWYTKKWRILRGQICGLARRVSNDLESKDFAGKSLDEIARMFLVDKLAPEILRRIRNGDKDGLWSCALSLLDRVDVYATVLRQVNERARTDGDRLNLVRPLEWYIEDRRIAQSTASQHRRMVWEAIDRISIGIASENNLSTNQRYSREHFVDILKKIEIYYSKNNHNMPKTVEGIWEYFDEFFVSAENIEDNEFIDDRSARISDTISLVRNTGFWVKLDICLDGLRTRDPQAHDCLVLEVHDEFGVHVARTVSGALSVEIFIEDFKKRLMKDENLDDDVADKKSRRWLSKKLYRARELMRACMEHALDAGPFRKHLRLL